MKGSWDDLTITRDGKYRLTVTVDENCGDLYDELHEAPVSIEIKKLRQKRSLDANAYAWLLIDKIAEKMCLTKEEVYRHQIKSIGGVSEIVCVQNRALGKLKEVWEAHGIGWQVETLDSKIEGCTNAVLYYGSSVYDTQQMTSLIELLIREAESLGIPTITPDEEKKLLGRWDNGGKHHPE